MGLDHTFVGDLVGTLSAPDGTTVTLFDRTGGTGVNLCRTELSYAANRSIQLAVDTDAPFTGSWRPAEPLARAVYQDGWRPAYAPGPTRDELVDVIRAALPAA